MWKPVSQLAEQASHLRLHQRSLLNQILIRQYFVRGPTREEPTLRHQDNFRPSLSHELYVMADNDDSLSLRVELKYEVPQTLLLQIVLTNRRLVKNQIIRLPGQDRRESRPLPLSTTE